MRFVGTLDRVFPVRVVHWLPEVEQFNDGSIMNFVGLPRACEDRMPRIDISKVPWLANVP